MTVDAELTSPHEVGRDAAHNARMFWRYWSASTVSNVGDAISAVALPLTAVTVLHASSFEVSLVAAATYAAWVLIGLPAGVLVQRLPLRATQVAMDLTRAVALGSIPVCAWTHHLSLGLLVGVAFVVSLASVVFDVGNSTFMVEVVSKAELTRRNSLNSGTLSVTQTGGPSLGGVLVQLVGAASAVAFDVGSYLVSAAILSRLPRVPVTERPRGTSIAADIHAGWLYVVRHPVIRPCVGIASLINFVCGALLALTPLFLVRTLHAPVGLVGVLIATEGVGSLIGASLTPRLVTRYGSARSIVVAGVTSTLFAILMPLAFHGPGVILFGIGNAGFAGGVVVASVVTRTHRQQVVPGDLLPRVMATVRFVSWGMIPVGAVLAGGIASTLGVRAALWIFCGLVVLVPTVALASRVGSLRDLTEAT